MKQYIKKLLLVASLFVLLLVMAFSVRYAIANSHEWKVPSKVHVLFMGASHITRGIDDSLMETALNWSSPSERYMFTYIKLERLLDNNPQIDTFFLQCSATDLWEDTDYKYHDANEQSKYVKCYWPFMRKEQLMVYKEEASQAIHFALNGLFATDDITQSKWWNTLGGYAPLSTTFDSNYIHPDREKPRGYGHDVNYAYLRKISTLCKDKNVKLVLLQCPVLHLDYYYDMDYFYHALHDNFSDIEFADFSNFEVPDDYRYDPHHLNNIGAELFTKELKRIYNIY